MFKKSIDGQIEAAARATLKAETEYVLDDYKNALLSSVFRIVSRFFCT
jgi:hypothetical protein